MEFDDDFLYEEDKMLVMKTSWNKFFFFANRTRNYFWMFVFVDVLKIFRGTSSFRRVAILLQIEVNE